MEKQQFKAIEILLVEDNPNDIELALRAFEKHNLINKVHVVRDGEEALAFIFGQGDYKDRDVNIQPKVILLDLKLPKINGLEVLAELKKNPKTQTIPVAVLTTSREDKDIIESYKLGVNSYIVKPVDFNKFVKAVSDIGLYWLLLNELPD